MPPAPLFTIGFSERDHALMDELSAKARAGRLTPHEQTVLDTFERLGCLLDIVHSKARQAIEKAQEVLLILTPLTERAVGLDPVLRNESQSVCGRGIHQSDVSGFGIERGCPKIQ